MDTRTLCKAAGIAVSQLTVWQQRGLIPGYAVNAQGRRRNYTADTGVHVAIMGALSRMGVGPAAATAIATQAQEAAPRRRYLLVMPEMPSYLDSEMIVHDPARMRELKTLMRNVPATVSLNRMDQIEPYLATHSVIRGPDVFMVIDVGTIRDRMAKAEARDGVGEEPKAKRVD